jgi:hypothetical protein
MSNKEKPILLKKYEEEKIENYLFLLFLARCIKEFI